MSWIAVGSAAVGLYSANKQSKAAKRGADGQVEASEASIEEQRRQFDLTRQDMMPFQQAGVGALARQEQVMQGDYSGFENSPDYQFARQQGLQSLERGAAARGGFMGGGADADRMQFASGLASQNLNNYWSKLAGQAGQGYQAGQFMGMAGQNMANNVGNQMMQGANARASSYATQANNWNQVGQQLVGAWGQYQAGRNN